MTAITLIKGIGIGKGIDGQGRSQDFSKGGGGSHCVKHYRHGVFATEYCTLFPLKKKAYKEVGGGGTGTPGSPLATPLWPLCWMKAYSNMLISNKHLSIIKNID